MSALEIAADLAAHGAQHVVVTQRRQRYVLPKFAAGVPSDHRMFTRYGGALADEVLPVAEIDRQLKEIVVESAGSPRAVRRPPASGRLALCRGRDAQPELPARRRGRIGHRPTLAAVGRRDGSDIR